MTTLKSIGTQKSERQIYNVMFKIKLLNKINSDKVLFQSYENTRLVFFIPTFENCHTTTQN